MTSFSTLYPIQEIIAFCFIFPECAWDHRMLTSKESYYHCDSTWKHWAFSLLVPQGTRFLFRIRVPGQTPCRVSQSHLPTVTFSVFFRHSAHSILHPSVLTHCLLPFLSWPMHLVLDYFLYANTFTPVSFESVFC